VECDIEINALQVIATKQEEAFKTIKDNGFVFKDLGREPGNWQHLAFTLYTMLCEIDVIAKTALLEGENGN